MGRVKEASETCDNCGERYWKEDGEYDKQGRFMCQYCLEGFADLHTKHREEKEQDESLDKCK